MNTVSTVYPVGMFNQKFRRTRSTRREKDGTTQSYLAAVLFEKRATIRGRSWFDRDIVSPV